MWLNAVVACTSSLKRPPVIHVMSARRIADRAGRTFRSLTTIGSSLRSSFSRAGTSMEYTRSTAFTSAV